MHNLPIEIISILSTHYKEIILIDFVPYCRYSLHRYAHMYPREQCNDQYSQREQLTHKKRQP